MLGKEQGLRGSKQANGCPLVDEWMEWREGEHDRNTAAKGTQ